MKEIHIIIGVLALAANAAAAAWGGWCWYQVRASPVFWRMLRTAQLVVLIETLFGGVLLLTGKHASNLHLIYGVLPMLVSLIAELLRISSAQMVLDARGLSSAAAVGELEQADQRRVVLAIVQREIGVMALSALVVVVLLARAAGTA